MCQVVVLLPGEHTVVAWPHYSRGSTSYYFRDHLNATEHKLYVNATWLILKFRVTFF